MACAGTAELVILAADAEPLEILLHLFKTQNASKILKV